jgi:DNA mismatch repair protein MutS2
MNNKKNKFIERSLEELEFPELLSHVAKFAHSEKAHELVLALRPVQDVEFLRIELNEIQEMCEILSHEETLNFDGFDDLSMKIRKSKISGSVMRSEEILQVQDLIVSCRRVANYFLNINQNYPLLIERASKIYHSKQLERHISGIITETGEIRDNASPELLRIRKEIQSKSQHLRSRISKILQKTMEEDIAQDDFVSIREDRFVIPIKAANKRSFEGIIHGVSKTGQTVFLEPSEIIEMNNDISLLINEEKREVYRLLEQLTREVSTHSENFLKSIEIIAHIDSLKARADFALAFGGEKPEIIEENEIILDQIFHPLLLIKSGKENTVPLDIDINSEKSAYVISGPNAGGKTVALKTVGLSVAMATSGIFPLGRCKTSPKTIYSSIGDHQSIENDLSTFSSQLSEIKAIIDFAGSDSLVLIDEICSGTDPHEGSALACGIMDVFLESKVNFVVTTHQSTLKNYALQTDAITNASLEFDEENLRPTYKFLPGIPGSSYAFNLARSIGLSDYVMKHSEKYTFSGQLNLEKSISELNKFKREAQSAREKAVESQKNLEEQAEKYNQKLDKLKIKQSDYLANAKEQAAEIVSNANKLIENTVREIKEKSRSVGDVRKEFEEKKSEIINKAEEVQKPVLSTNYNIKLNDTVHMKDSENLGQVLEISQDGKSALVDFGGMKIRTKISKLYKSNKTLKEDKSNYSSYIKFDAKTQIDVRGKRASEALPEIEKFLSDAVAANLFSITILHGKGTGALRLAIGELLLNSNFVESYRDGSTEEGGTGVTIVSL